MSALRCVAFLLLISAGFSQSVILSLTDTATGYTNLYAAINTGKFLKLSNSTSPSGPIFLGLIKSSVVYVDDSGGPGRQYMRSVDDETGWSAKDFGGNASFYCAEASCGAPPLQVAPCSDPLDMVWRSDEFTFVIASTYGLEKPRPFYKIDPNKFLTSTAKLYGCD